MNEIKLTKWHTVVVDESDFDFLNSFRWYATKSYNTFYAVRNVFDANGNRRMSYMHHWIVGFPLGGKVVDHIDGNSLNNSRSNLRIVSKRANLSNRKDYRNETKSSRFVGVRWDKNAEKWRSQIKINGKQEHIGLFEKEQDAADAYLGKLVIG